MTREKKAERNKRIAADVAAGMLIGSAATKYGVGFTTAWYACREAGLQRQTAYKPIRKPDSAKDAAALKSLCKSSRATARRVAKLAKRATKP